MSKRLIDTLNCAKKNKRDEFYTQLSDIEKELIHYENHFKDKIVYCNCDDPTVSQFFHYFSYKFKKLSLKKLVTTCYKHSNIDLFNQGEDEKAGYLIYEGDDNNVPLRESIKMKPLESDGDFRSDDCINLLKKADIVVTNPPFSLFREYISQLFKYEKKFLIMGDQNAITCKETFQLVKENKLWTGITNGGNKWFEVPMDYDIKTKSHIKEKNGKKYFKKRSVYWYTNLDIAKRHEDMILYKRYQNNESDYPFYDNYRAINVDRCSDIPKDYDGYMGVPITFFDKYNPNQFEIIDLDINLV
ncbi:adenine-specific methyltransferase EcoRI family protein, partial [Candidatus Liberibacter solanacearum]